MPNNNPDPDMLAELSEEVEFAKKGNRPNRLKLEPETGLVVRYLPAQIGDTKRWYGRVGTHWMLKKSIICSKTTSPHLGGDPEGACPVCDLAERLSLDPTLSKTGDDLSANVRYLTYVLAVEEIDKALERTPVKRSERWSPQALWVPRGAFAKLDVVWKKSLKRSAGGFIDPVGGSNVEILVDKQRRWTVSLEDQTPIRDDISDDDIVAWVDEMCAEIKLEPTQPATAAELSKFARTVESQLDGGAPDEPRSRPARRFQEEDAEAGEPAAPPPRRPAAAPAPRPAAPAPLRTAKAPASAPAATPPPARKAVRPPPEDTPSAGEPEPEEDAVAPESHDPAPAEPEDNDDSAAPEEEAPPPPARTQKRFSPALEKTLRRPL